MSATITYAFNQARGTFWMSHGDNLDAVKTFARKLLPYTHADVDMVTHTVGEDVDYSGQGGGAMTALNQYAHIFLRREEDDKLFAFKLAAPVKAAIFNDEERVTQAFGAQLARWYSDLAGEKFEFAHGGLVSGTIDVW